jgi:predicted permease
MRARDHWDVLRQDVRGAVRLLTRNPGFSATAILTLALGIGGSTSIFSVVYAVVLRPLSFPESERVVRIGWAREGDKALGLRTVSPRDFRVLREKCIACEAIGATGVDSLSSDEGSLLHWLPPSGAIGVGQSFVPPLMVSADVFEIFGATTALGRLPTEQDEQPGAGPVAVISYKTWTSLYGRSPDVIGRTLWRNFGEGHRKSVTIVGVLAPDAFGYDHGTMADVAAWGALDSDALARRDDQGREIFNLSIYARVARGATLDMARAQIASLTPYLAVDLPEYLAAPQVVSLNAVRLRDLAVASVRTPLLAFLGAVICLLLLASVNVASLVLARAFSRRQEFAARFALGASPFRVARQLLTESATLAACGGLLGLGLAWAARRAFVSISPAMPRLDQSGVDVPALIFALFAVLLATCVAGLTPALHSSRRSVLDGLRRSGGAPTTSTSFSRPLATLAAIEIALVLVLLAGTGLLVNSFARLFVFDLGFDARSTIVTMIERTADPSTSRRTTPPQPQQRVAALSDRQRQQRALDDEIVRSVSEIPGIEAAGITGDVPFGPPYRYAVDITIGELPVEASLRLASPDALNALRMRMAAGRWFAASDRDGRPYVAIVNETMARRFWSERVPVGDRITFGHRSLEVVGIVADVHDRGARSEVAPTFYLSTAQIPADPLMLVVRPRPGVQGLERVIAGELARLGDRIKPGGPRRLEDLWWRQLTDARFLTTVLSVFSALALAVALVGVHGVLRFLVAQRTRELGIRKALGATPPHLIALVVRQALRFAIPGCLVGLVAAAAAAPALRSLLFGITPTDPLTLAAATALIVVTVLAGAYFPARRASAVDPALSLRAE